MTDKQRTVRKWTSESYQELSDLIYFYSFFLVGRVLEEQNESRDCSHFYTEEKQENRPPFCPLMIT